MKDESRGYKAGEKRQSVYQTDNLEVFNDIHS